MCELLHHNVLPNPHWVLLWQWNNHSTKGLLTFEVQPQVLNFVEVDALSVCHFPQLPLRTLFRHTFPQEGFTDRVGLYTVVQMTHGGGRFRYFLEIEHTLSIRCQGRRGILEF